MSDILVIAAHPDDETLGAGGLLHKYRKQKISVSCMTLTDGVGARKEPDIKGARHERESAFTQVAQKLSFQNTYQESFPDNAMDSVPFLDIAKTVEKIVAKEQPKTILTNFEGDLNIDHRLTFQAVLTACRPGCFASVQEIISFEVPSSTECAIGIQSVPSFQPNYFVDIEHELEEKIETMKLYDAELRSYPHPRSPEALRARAHYWGSCSGLLAAESFVLVRKLG